MPGNADLTAIIDAAASGLSTFNITIQTPNSGAFRESQDQIAAMLSQAVSGGQRNL